MEYRKLPRGKEDISIIGFGTSSIGQADEKEIDETIKTALENGINYFDLASSDAAPFYSLGRVADAFRDKIYYQIHFGADYSSGKYGWCQDLQAIKNSVKWQLETLKTDYIDFGFIHCIDEEADLNKIISNGTLDYIKGLKEKGIIHHIGLSSHTPKLVNKILDMGLIDMLMFSINPAYDYCHDGEFAFGETDERIALYERCRTEGVGISVMKVFSGGQLLNEKTSPFGQALTENQCIQYALDKPGVLTVLPGIRNRKDLKRILKFLTAEQHERDYSFIKSFIPQQTKGTCVYCNHCQPCPAGLDIGLINKYYDLSLAGDILAGDHYLNLKKKASDCIACGHCDKRCPFHVKQLQRMKEIKSYFGK